MTSVMGVWEYLWQQSRARLREFGYNYPMRQTHFPFHTERLLRLALILWIAYFCILALVDWWLVDRDTNVLLYYAVQAFNGLLILGIAFVLRRYTRSEKLMRPFVLVLMAVLPTLTVHLMLRAAPSEILRSAEGMTLRLTPILLMGMLLTAWYYRWRHVVLFCLGVAAANLLGLYMLPPYRSIIRFFPLGPMTVTGIQTISLFMVGYITSVLVSRLRGQQQTLEEANAQLRAQASTQMELTISRERNRMARELHDTLAHTLSGLTVQLQTVKAYREIEPATSEKMLDDALAATRDGLQETRDALKSLRATPLEDLGLPLAISQLAEEAAARASLELDLEITEPLPLLAPEVGHALYRIAQEAIMNVVYHANATTLSVEVKSNGDSIELAVADDGGGFDTNRTHPNHWGIEGMQERAHLINGQLLIESQTGCGTSVQLIILEKIS